PINREKLILIDTGCVYHMKPGMGRLTAVHLPEREFIDVPYSD
ncbi:MAG: serine/threonine protein phosphatase, partial [Bacteroidetes bacterium QS_4_64_154]